MPGDQELQSLRSPRNKSSCAGSVGRRVPSRGAALQTQMRAMTRTCQEAAAELQAERQARDIAEMETKRLRDFLESVNTKLEAAEERLQEDLQQNQDARTRAGDVATKFAETSAALSRTNRELSGLHLSKRSMEQQIECLKDELASLEAEAQECHQRAAGVDQPALSGPVDPPPGPRTLGDLKVTAAPAVSAAVRDPPDLGLVPAPKQDQQKDLALDRGPVSRDLVCVVALQHVVVRSDPDLQSQVVGNLPEGSRLWVDAQVVAVESAKGQVLDRCRVRTPLSGWVTAKFFRPVGGDTAKPTDREALVEDLLVQGLHETPSTPSDELGVNLGDDDDSAAPTSVSSEMSSTEQPPKFEVSARAFGLAVQDADGASRSVERGEGPRASLPARGGDAASAGGPTRFSAASPGSPVEAPAPPVAVAAPAQPVPSSVASRAGPSAALGLPEQGSGGVVSAPKEVDCAEAWQRASPLLPSPET